MEAQWTNVFASKSSIIYFFVCVRQCALACTCACVWVCEGVGVCGYQCASAHVPLSCMQKACAVYCHLWPLWLHHIFPHHLINGTVFRKKLLNIKCVFWFSLPLLSKIFRSLRRIQRDIVINVKTSTYKVFVIFVGHKWYFNFVDSFLEKAQTWVVIKIVPFGTEFLHAFRWMDGRDEANCLFWKFYWRAKLYSKSTHRIFLFTLRLKFNSLKVSRFHHEKIFRFDVSNSCTILRDSI